MRGEIRIFDKRKNRKSCEGCGACCGKMLPLNMNEKFRLQMYARSLAHKGFPFNDDDLMCPFLKEDTMTCSIYSKRPTICREYSCHDHRTGRLFYNENLISEVDKGTLRLTDVRSITCNLS